MKIDKEKIYLIEWQDAHSAAAWHDSTEVDRFINKERCIVQEVGWILSETKDEIVMAGRTLKWGDDNGESPEWGALQKIPKTWIRKIKFIVKQPRK